MDTQKELGQPTASSEETQDLKRAAGRKPNLAVVASWIFGTLLVVIVLASAVLSG